MTTADTLLQPHLLSDTVYLLSAEGGNVGLCAGKDGALLVDIPQEAELSRIQAGVDSLAPGNLRLLVNTHAHADHVAGNVLLGDDMPIIAHTNTRKRLKTDQRITVGVKAFHPAQPPIAWPNLVFDQEITLHLNGEEIQLTHFPQGHSDCDIIVWFRNANVVHVGDIFWPRSFPFVDVENGGSVMGLIQNVKKLIDLLPASIQIIPGHGPVSDVKELKKYHRMLVETTDWIDKQRQANQRSKDIAQTMPDKWQSCGKAFISTDAWVDLVLYSLGDSDRGTT
ncbi:MAG: MBL fold metallo-hydrolase [Anaerolineae bacterium]|nr:MBL fold metallo-hydrolase [Anaerolineae bacterium]